MGNFLAMESGNSLRISAPQWWPLREGRDGKCEGRKEKCEFLARESVSSSPIVRIFGKGKCKFIANFSATLVTSLPSFSVSLSLSLSPKVPHAQYRKRFRASYNVDRRRWRAHQLTSDLKRCLLFRKCLRFFESESSFGACVCHRRPGGSTATSHLVMQWWGLYEYVIVHANVIVHTSLGGSPVILWISLGGKP